MSGFSTSKEGREEALANGWQVIVPKDNELILDIDTEEQISNSIEAMQSFDDLISFSATYPSKSGEPNHYHVYITLYSPLSIIERIAFQAILGSDRLRELNAFRRYMLKDPEPILAFESEDFKRL